MSLLFQAIEKFYKGKRIWREVEEELKKERIKFSDFYDPFKNLVIGILSQNTSDRNSTRAYINLAKKVEINPNSICKTSLRKIRDAIRCGGLFNIKAKRIKELAKIVLKEYDGDLKKITRLPVEIARKELLKLPGIGQKTADVFIGYCMKKDSLPIDTNIARVAKRIGVVGKNANYQEIKNALSKILPEGKFLKAHEYLIRVGRDFCKARKPLCKQCPIKNLCNFQKSFN